MDRAAKRSATAGALSTLTLTTFSEPAKVYAARSTPGSRIRQG